MLRTDNARSATRPAFADRPPILDALRALGLKDAQVARAIGCTSEFIAAWRNGRKPIPHKTHIALLFIVGRLTGQVASWIPPQTVYARRAEVAVEAATLWGNLARNEFLETLGTDDPFRDHPDLMWEGYELGERALARIEKADPL